MRHAVESHGDRARRRHELSRRGCVAGAERHLGTQEDALGSAGGDPVDHEERERILRQPRLAQRSAADAQQLDRHPAHILVGELDVADDEVSRLAAVGDVQLHRVAGAGIPPAISWL
jgi:hypothetical protein